MPDSMPNIMHNDCNAQDSRWLAFREEYNEVFTWADVVAYFGLAS